jgi:hypothetical protein
LIEVLSGSTGGFQRLNDGSLTLNIGGRLVVCETEQGETVLEDDFDPIPPEIQPSEEQLREIRNHTRLLEEVLDENLDAYIFDKRYWESGEGLASDQFCGGIPQDAIISAVIDKGNEQGFGTKLTNVSQLSASLHFTGKARSVLIGRYILSRSLDLARGALIQLGLRKGEGKWPSPCESPDQGDDLHLMLRTEAYTAGVSVPNWYERNLWTRIESFDPLDGSLKGSTFVPIQKVLSANRHILGTTKPAQNMIDCLRNRNCNSSLGRIILLQPSHGSGPYDVWAVDNINIVAMGGIINDRRAVCRSPPADAFDGKDMDKNQVTFALNGFQFAPAGAGNPDGRTHFIYYDEPIITSVLPSGGPDEGGTEITLIGSGFKNFADKNYPPKCKFGTQMTDALIFSDNMVKCPEVRNTVYNGFASVSFALNGVDFTSAPPRYIYYEQPLIYSLYPDSGPWRGGTKMHVIGKGFIYLTPFPSTCKFTAIHSPDTFIVTPAQYLNDSLLLCKTPNASTWFLDDELSVDAIVEISLNDQQYTSLNAVVFTFFVDPIIIRAEQFTKNNKLVINGGEPVSVYGRKLRSVRVCSVVSCFARLCMPEPACVSLILDVN